MKPKNKVRLMFTMTHVDLMRIWADLNEEDLNLVLENFPESVQDKIAETDIEECAQLLRNYALSVSSLQGAKMFKDQDELQEFRFLSRAVASRLIDYFIGIEIENGMSTSTGAYWKD